MSAKVGWIQAIQDILRDGLVCPDAELHEADKDSKCEAIKLRRCGKSLLISFNALIAFKSRADPVCIKDRLFPMFREHEGIARMCDYWILSEQEGKEPTLYVLLCELKSGDPAGALAQLENARLLAEYFVRMVAHHHQLGMDRVEYRGVVFSRVYKTPKAGLRPRKPIYEERGRLHLPVAFLSDGTECVVSALCA